MSASITSRHVETFFVQKELEEYNEKNSYTKLLIQSAENEKDQTWYKVHTQSKIFSDCQGDLSNDSMQSYLFRPNYWNLIYLGASSYSYLTKSFFKKVFQSLKQGGSVVFIPKIFCDLKSVEQIDIHHQTTKIVMNHFFQLDLAFLPFLKKKSDFYEIKKLQDYLEKKFLKNFECHQLSIYINRLSDLYGCCKEINSEWIETQSNQIKIKIDQDEEKINQKGFPDELEIFRKEKKGQEFKLLHKEILKLIENSSESLKMINEHHHCVEYGKIPPRSYSHALIILKHHDQSLNRIYDSEKITRGGNNEMFVIATKN